MPITVINPATGSASGSYPETSRRERDQLVTAAARAQRAWRRAAFAERGVILRAVARRLRERQEDFGRLMATEMGKPVAQGRGEAEKCAWLCEYYAEHAEGFLTDEPIATDAAKSGVTFEPLGVILAVMPWNFPFWQVVRAAVPALMAGNAVILKHASNVPGCAKAIEQVFADGGLPTGLFGNILAGSAVVAELIQNPAIQGVTLTGSTRAGAAVASQAGAALKKSVLELGGSDPYLILEDADLDAAAETCAASRLVNSGQSCIAAKRFIVVQAVRKAFEERLVAQLRVHRMGDPLDEAHTVGPLARHDLRDELHGQVTQSEAQGARLVLGGRIPNDRGAYYPPTVLTGVQPGMPAFDQETFGPVAAVIGAQDEADAIRLANASPFGLGAAVFTRDVARGERIAARELEAGCCFVNAFVKSDPRLPFGGVKQSGYGRELSSFGLKEFVNVKSVYVAAG